MTSAALPLAHEMHSYEQIFADKQRILFVLAHPDDLIVSYGALLGKLVEDKKDIYVVTVTNGARGSREHDVGEDTLASQRIEEELTTLDFIGIPREHYTCLNYKDGEVESNFKLIGEIAYFFRKYKIDLVCTHEPTMIYSTTYDKSGFFVQHRDHRKVAEAVVDAAYPFSRDRSFFPEHAKEGIEPHTVQHLVFTDDLQCNFKIDYTEQMQRKKQALLLHKSQFDEPTAMDFLNAVKEGDHYMEKYFYVNLLW